MTSTPHSPNRRPLGLILFLLALAIVLPVAFNKFFFLPKILIIVLILLAAALLGRIKLLVKDWFIFISFLYLFDSLRGTIYILTCKLQLPVHALYVLNLEKSLFGEVPSVWLQHLLLRPDPAGNFTWLERILTVFYGSHFIAFLFVGFIIWLYKSKSFPLFKTSFYLLSGIGVLFYFLVPTVPPWMAASQFDLLPPLTRFNGLLLETVVADISNGFDTNPIAAMPSLHAAFPILSSLLLWKLYKWKAAVFYVYTTVVLFTIVYTGDHYVVDVLAGLALAVACYAVAAQMSRRSRSDASGDPVQGEASTASNAAMNKKVLLGLGVFLVGVAIGSANKTQFLLNPTSYGMDVPRYADFFRKGDRYKDSFPIQIYLGNHYLAQRDYRNALGHLERCAELARDSREVDYIEMRLRECRRMLDLKK
ncbi:MAG: phosphatase PAP2 family protein [Candidatus Aminicenantales bacterium]